MGQPISITRTMTLEHAPVGHGRFDREAGRRGGGGGGKQLRQDRKGGADFATLLGVGSIAA